VTIDREERAATDALELRLNEVFAGAPLLRVHRVCTMLLLAAEVRRAGGDEAAAAGRLARGYKRMKGDFNLSGRMGGAR